MVESVYRFAAKGNSGIPLQVRSTGYYRVWNGWKDLVIRKFFVELFWCIDGVGKFEYEDGRTIMLTPGQCCCYFPGDRHKVSADADFELCWLTFDGDNCIEVAKHFSLDRTSWYAGKCPQELFARLRREIRKPGVSGELASSVTGYEILCRATLSCGDGEDDKLVEKFVAEVESSCEDPALTIEEIAGRLGVHRSTLMRKVTAVCGESPQKYLTECRLQKAFALLQDSGLSIKEISEHCGFASANYFCKVFARTYGKAPGKMRRSC